MLGARDSTKSSVRVLGASDSEARAWDEGTSPQIRETTLETGGTRVVPLVSVSASAADTEKFFMNDNHVPTGRRGLC